MVVSNPKHCLSKGWLRCWYCCICYYVTVAVTSAFDLGPCYTSNGEPGHLQEAPDDSKWNKATEDEHLDLQENNIWHLILHHQGKNMTYCKWVFKVKWKADGEIDRYMACLVAKSFQQRYIWLGL